MPISRVDIIDDEFEAFIIKTLANNGFSPVRRGDLIELRGVGYKHGDRSVNLELNLVEMDGHRILEFKSLIPTKPMSFNQAVLVAAHGNQQALISKFSPLENMDGQYHQIISSFVINVENLKVKELTTMVYLFVKEVDRIDNELIEMAESLRLHT